MVSARVVTAFVLAASAGFIIANCGGSSDSSSSPADVLSCMGNNPQQSQCTQAQTKPYSDCVLGKCDAQYQACFGAGYKSGTFSGPCGPYLTCASKCGCTDTACKAACTPTAECSTCLGMIGTCALGSGCALPVCGGADAAAGGGGTGCAGLAACCAAIVDATQKAQCQQVLSAAQMAGAQGDAACSSTLQIFRLGHQCP